ncbi:alpha/beta hydrolase [Flavobacteriaceae bacterium S0825]|uniref:alpha/beta hydrolase n=1 Tax=Gaetbulibacter sp. S0825 TaxID=2720084 RepID=UPI001430E0D3|nr:alpha/beta hydrolase [Gaetbulibacter sp. S0825]MCK0110041.1 alpha/beta hydrolase [Flavobacteriaceae bacterium S0825]NIX65670.1 alpha/beta hydrolase [Gaetbulibacter sp. S0825]
MKTPKSALLSIICTFLLFACSLNDDNNIPNTNTLNPTQYYQELDVAYGNDAKQTFDIYLPADRENTTKVMILVHGGGWSGGDKSEMNLFKNFVRQEHPNVAIVNMNYRLADDNNNPYPMQINDITSVINHLKENSEHYTIGDDFGFIGVSAGGHLSLLWSYAFDTDNDVKMVCSVVGPTNFTDPAYLNNNDAHLQELLDLFGVEPTTAFLEEVSPLHRVTASAPPTILFYGGQDPLIPTTQGTALRDELSDLGVTHEFTLYPDAGHGWVGTDLLDTVLKLKAFTQTYLE